ncbi:MAG: hypothetical protein ACKO3H_07690, partial [Verrucomicrobiota bacterium]
QADSVGQVVGAIYKTEDGTLTLADYPITGEPPKTFGDAANRYVLKRVHTSKKDSGPPQTK